MSTTIFSTIITYITKHGANILLKAFLAMGIFVVGYLCIQWIVRKIRKRMENNSLEENIYSKRASNLVGKIISVVLVIFLILAICQVIGLDTAIIMGGISLSMGFAMEKTIGNMIAGIMILTNKKVKIGDFVQLLGKISLLGTIEEINMRYTVVRTFDKRRTIVPNSILAKTPIKTYKVEPLIRGEIFFTVPRHTAIAQVKDILISTINSHKKVLYKEYTNVRIDDFDKCGIKIKSVFFSNPQVKSPFMIARDLRPLIAANLKKYGINIPYPHITLTTE